MSGRLVILRHKKWNVWNQDNIEKVLKDERLDAEKQAKLRETQQKSESEARMQQLRLDSSDAHNYSTKSERLIDRNEGNKEFEAEKKAESLLNEQKGGIPDFSFNHGINHLEQLNSWFKNPSLNRHVDNLPEYADRDEKRAKDRALRRIQAEDPMSEYISSKNKQNNDDDDGGKTVGSAGISIEKKKHHHHHHHRYNDNDSDKDRSHNKKKKKSRSRSRHK